MSNIKTITLPISTTSEDPINFISIENPNRIKKKVLIKKELSAVNEWSKCVVSSTSSFGKKFTNSGDLRRWRLFMSKPKIRIMRRER